MAHPLIVREAASLDDLVAMGGVFEAVWRDGQPPTNLTKAIQHAGGYAAIADDGERVVAGSLGFIGRRADGTMLLHSHITGTLPGLADRGVGFAIKQHQRAWCLERGIETVTWTFDPLVRRNAYFNLTKLGAEATEYHADFYGAMDDAINRGDETDRVVATWRLTSARAVAAAAGMRVTSEDLGPIALDVGDRGEPVVVEDVAGSTLRFRLPTEIALDQHRLWRHAVRTTLGAALQDGYVGVAVTTDGCYVLRRES